MNERVPWFTEDVEIEKWQKLWVQGEWETKEEHSRRITDFFVEQLLSSD